MIRRPGEGLSDAPMTAIDFGLKRASICTGPFLGVGGSLFPKLNAIIISDICRSCHQQSRIRLELAVAIRHQTMNRMRAAAALPRASTGLATPSSPRGGNNPDRCRTADAHRRKAGHAK